jgi:hypothetical protein
MKIEAQIDRRQLVKLGLSASMIATLPLAGITLAGNSSEKLLRHIGDSDLPIDDSLTGALSQSEFETLFALCPFVDKAWNLKADLAQYRRQLQSDLELKTTRQPSYLTEYRNAIELIDLIARDTSSSEQIWTSLLFSNFDQEQFSTTQLGRARHFVFYEIIAHQIPISGAFKSFGLVNYRGYFGGPYASPVSYRRGDVT